MKTQQNSYQGKDRLALRILSFALAVLLIFGQRTSVISAFADAIDPGESGSVVEDRIEDSDGSRNFGEDADSGDSSDDSGEDDPDGNLELDGQAANTELEGQSSDDESEGQSSDDESEGQSSDDESEGQSSDDESEGQSSDDESEGQSSDAELEGQPIDPGLESQSSSEEVAGKEITVQLNGEIADFSGVQIALLAAENVIEETEAGANGEVSFTLPEDGDTFRVAVSGLSGDFEIVGQGWRLNGRTYSQDFTREALESRGRIDVEVTKVIVPEETFTLSVQVNDESAKMGIARTFGGLFGGKTTVEGLDVKLVQLANGSETELKSGTTDSAGKIELADITLDPDDSVKYRVYISGFDSKYKIDGNEWIRSGTRFYQEFTKTQLLAIKDTGLTISLVGMEAGTLIALTPNVYLDNNFISGAEVTLDILDENGNPIAGQSEMKETDQYGQVYWTNLPSDVKYRLTVKAPVEGAYLTKTSAELEGSGYKNFKTENGFNYYIFEIDPMSEYIADNFGYFHTIDFLTTRLDLTVEKQFDGISAGDDVWIGILPSNNLNQPIVWEQVLPDGSGGYSAIFEAINKLNDKLENGLVSDTSAGLTYYLFEYAPGDMEPDGNWRYPSTQRNLPVDPPREGYVLWERDAIFALNRLSTEQQIDVVNKKAELSFKDDGLSLEATYVAKAYTGYWYKWTPKKTVRVTEPDYLKSAAAALSDKGEPFTAHYKVEFTRDEGASVDDKVTLYFNNSQAKLIYDKRLATPGSENYVEGQFILYKNGTPIDQSPLTQWPLSDCQGYDSTHVLKTLVSPTLQDTNFDKNANDRYDIGFTGTYYYNTKGYETEGDPFITKEISKKMGTPISNVQIINRVDEGSASDKQLKDFIDTITLPTSSAEIVDVQNFKVNNSVKNPVVDKAGKTIKYTGVMMSPAANRVLTIEYDVLYVDTSWEIPCMDSYTINNKAQATGWETPRTYSDTANVNVTVPAFAYFKTNKIKNGENINNTYETVTFALYDGDTLRGTATTNGTVTPVIFTKTPATPSPTEIDAGNYGNILKITELNGTKSYKLVITSGLDAKYPPYKADGTIWEKDGSGNWYTMISLTANADGTYKGLFCGPTTITTYNKPDTSITITKTGLGFASAEFYVNKSGATKAIKLNSTVSGTTKTFSLAHLEYGVYDLYEVTDAKYNPGAGWEKVSSVPGVSTTGKQVYKRTITIDLDANPKPVVAVANKELQQLKITKKVPGGLNDKLKEFTFLVKDTATGNTMKFKTGSPAGTFVYDPAGTAVLKITFTTSTADQSIIITGLPEASYTVEEVSPAVSGVVLYDVVVSGNGAVTIAGTDNAADLTKEVTVTNTKRTGTGSVSVKKVVEGGVDPTEYFAFTITKKDGTAVAITDSTVTFVPAGSGELVTGSTGKFKMTAGTIATISGLELGEEYVIVEDSYTGKFTTVNDKQDGANGSKTTAILIDGGTVVPVVFTNTRNNNPSLKVKKVIAPGTVISGNEVFALQIEGKFKTGNDIADGVKIVYFTQSGSSITVDKSVFGIPVANVLDGGNWGTEFTVPDAVNGAQYKVTEINYGTATLVSDFTVDYSPANGNATAAVSPIPVVTVTNSNKDGGELKIYKELTGSIEKDKTFTVNLTGNGTLLNFTKAGNVYTYSATAGAGTTTAITITGNQPATVRGIPNNMQVVVSETNIPAGYELVSIEGTGYTAAGYKVSSADQEVTVTNKISVGGAKLTVTKNVVGADAKVGNDRFIITVTGNFSDGTTPRVFTFAKTAASGVNAFGTKVEVPGVIAGETYTVTETADTGTVLANYTTKATGLAGLNTAQTQGTVTVVAGSTKDTAFTNTRITANGVLTKVLAFAKDHEPENTTFKFQLQEQDGTLVQEYTAVWTKNAPHTGWTKTSANGATQETWEYTVFANLDLVDPLKTYRVVELDGATEITGTGVIGKHFNVVVADAVKSTLGADNAYKWTFKVTNTAIATDVKANIKKTIDRNGNTAPTTSASTFKFELYDTAQGDAQTAPKLATATVTVGAGQYESAVTDFVLEPGVTLDANKTYAVREVESGDYKLKGAITGTAPDDLENNAKTWSFTATNLEPGAKASVTKVVSNAEGETPINRTFTFKLYEAAQPLGTALDTVVIDYVAGGPTTITKDFTFVLDPKKDYVVREMNADGTTPIENGGTYGEDGQGNYIYTVGYQDNGGVLDSATNLRNWAFTVTNSGKAQSATGKIVKTVDINGQSAPSQTEFKFGLYEATDTQFANELDVITVTVGGTGGIRTGEKAITYKLDPKKEYVVVEKEPGTYKVDPIGSTSPINNNERVWTFTAKNTEQGAEGTFTKTLSFKPGDENVRKDFTFQLQVQNGAKWDDVGARTNITFTQTDYTTGGPWTSNTVIFSGLDPAKTYRVVEIDDSGAVIEDGGQLGSHFTVNYTGEKSDLDTVKNMFTWTFTATNTFIEADVVANITKTLDRNGNTASDKTFNFELYNTVTNEVHGTAVVTVPAGGTTKTENFTITKPLDPDSDDYAVRETNSGTNKVAITGGGTYDDKTNVKTWSFSANNLELSARAKINKIVSPNGLKDLAAKEFKFELYSTDDQTTAGVATITPPATINTEWNYEADFMDPADTTKLAVIDPAKTYAVREVDASGKVIGNGEIIVNNGQQYKVEYPVATAPVADDGTNLKTWKFTVRNTALVSSGKITKVLNDTAANPLYKFFTFGIFDKSGKQVGDAQTVEVKQVGNTNVWEATTAEFPLEYGKEYYVKELSAYREKDNSGKAIGEVTGSALAASYAIIEASKLDDTTSAIAHTWDFTVTNTKKTASAEIIKKLVVRGDSPIQTTFNFNLIAKEGTRVISTEQYSLTVAKDPATGEWSASRIVTGLDPRYTYSFEEVGVTTLESNGYTVTVNPDVQGQGTNNVKYTYTITNSEPGTKTAQARITKILYTDYSNPRRDFSFNIMETKNGATTVFGTYTLSVLQTATSRYENTSELITGLDPDATYTIVEQDRQSLINSNYTIREVSSYTGDGTPMKTWTFTVTNTRYRDTTTTTTGGGGGRLARDGDGGSSTPTTSIGDNTVPLSTITDTEVPLTTIPETPVPLANLPITGRTLAAMLGSAGLLLLGVALLTRKKGED